MINEYHTKYRGILFHFVRNDEPFVSMRGAKRRGNLALLHLAIGIMFLFLLTTPQIFAGETPLTLEKMLALTMEKQSDILIGKLSIEAAEGAKLSSASAFDTQVSASASVTAADTPLKPYETALYGVSSAETAQREINLSASKTLRSGVTLSSELASTVTEDKTYNYPDDNARSLGVSLSVPWFDIVGGNAQGLREKAAVKDTKSAVFGYYHQITSGVYGTMSAWWSYLAAYESMNVYKQSKESMYKYMSDYRKLVEGDERPQSDLIQLEAKYNYVLMEANAAESSFRTAGYRLCTAVGVVCDSSMWENPSETWPEFDRVMTAISQTADESGREKRFDILSAEVSIEGKQLLIDALKRDEKPEISLSLSFQQTEKSENSSILSGGGGNSGSTVMTGLSFSMPLENSAVKGSLMQQYAAYRQSRVRLDELRRSADIDTETARQELLYAYESLKMATETEKLYAKAYETEKRKQSLGMTTVLDVVSTADSYRDALLQRIEYARQAAAAAAKYAYVSGRILTVENGSASVNTQFLP